MVTLDKQHLLHRPSKGTVRFFRLPFFSFFQKSKPQDPPSRHLTMVLKKIPFWLRIRRFFENLTPRSIRSKTNFCRWVSLHGGLILWGVNLPGGLIHWGVNLPGVWFTGESISLGGLIHWGVNLTGGLILWGVNLPGVCYHGHFFLQNLKIE